MLFRAGALCGVEGFLCLARVRGLGQIGHLHFLRETGMSFHVFNDHEQDFAASIQVNARFIRAQAVIVP